MMLGEMRLEGRMYRRGEPTLVGTGADLADQLAQAVALLPNEVFRPQRNGVSQPTLDQVFPLPEQVKPNSYALFNDRIGIRAPTVYDHDDRADRDVVNGPATEAARDKQEKIKERFKQWVWQDDERRERLARKYDDEFNNLRLRTFNGDHLTLKLTASKTCSTSRR